MISLDITVGKIWTDSLLVIIAPVQTREKRHHVTAETRHFVISILCRPPPPPPSTGCCGMETDLKCNRLTCRKLLTDKAVVTTCSHIFCVDCANELFNAARLCPACEASLTEPDDVVVCSLHPSNDYKTVHVKCIQRLYLTGLSSLSYRV